MAKESQTVDTMDQYYDQLDARQKVLYRYLEWELKQQQYLTDLQFKYKQSGREDIGLQIRAAEAQINAERLKLSQMGFDQSIRQEAMGIIEAAMKQVTEMQAAAREEVGDLRQQVVAYSSQRRAALGKVLEIAKQKNIQPSQDGTVRLFLSRLQTQGPYARDVANFWATYMGDKVPKDSKVAPVLYEIAEQYFRKIQAGTTPEEAFMDAGTATAVVLTPDLDDETKAAWTDYEQMDTQLITTQEELIAAKKLLDPSKYTESVKEVAQSMLSIRDAVAPSQGRYGPPQAGGEGQEAPEMGVIAGYLPDGKPVVLNPSEWGGTATSSDGSVYLAPAAGASMSTMMEIERFNRAQGKGKKIVPYPGKPITDAPLPSAPPPQSPGAGRPLASIADLPTTPQDIGNGMTFHVREGLGVFESSTGTWAVDPKSKRAQFKAPDGNISPPIPITQDPFANPQATGAALFSRVRPKAQGQAQGQLSPQAQYQVEGSVHAVMSKYEKELEAIGYQADKISAGKIEGMQPLGPSRMNMMLMDVAQKIASQHGGEPDGYYNYMVQYMTKNFPHRFMPYDTADKNQLGRQIQAWDRAWASGMPKEVGFTPPSGEKQVGTGTGLPDSAATFPRISGPRGPGPMPLLTYFDPDYLSKFTYKQGE